MPIDLYHVKSRWVRRPVIVALLIIAIFIVLPVGVAAEFSAQMIASARCLAREIREFFRDVFCPELKELWSADYEAD